jgi:hypothetical protein
MGGVERRGRLRISNPRATGTRRRLICRTVVLVAIVIRHVAFGLELDVEPGANTASAPAGGSA